MLKIGNTLLISFTAISMVIILLLSTIFFQFEKKSLLKSSQQQLEFIADNKKRLTLTLLKQNKEKFALTASRTQLRISLEQYTNLSTSADEKNLALKKMRKISNDAIASISNFNHLIIFDQKNLPILSVGDQEYNKQSNKDQSNGKSSSFSKSSIDQIMNAKQFKQARQFIKVTRLEKLGDNNISFILSGPLRLNNELIGTMVIFANAKSFIFQVNEYAGSGDTGQATLIEKIQTDAYHFLTPYEDSRKTQLGLTKTQNSLDFFGLRLPLHLTYLLKDENHFLNSKSHQDSRYQYSIRAFDDNQWYLLIKKDLIEILQPLELVKNTLYFTSGIVMLIVIAFSMIISRGISSPISSLSVIALQLENGNLSQRANELHGGQEIREFAHTFNTMTDKLLNVNVLLEKKILLLNSEIENRVLAEKALKIEEQSLEKRVVLRTTQLEEVNQELKSFSYSVSHDLRAPLRAIHGFSQALEEDFSDQLDDTATSYLLRIKNAANRMDNLITSILGLSRVNQVDINICQCNLSEIANELVNELALGQQSLKDSFTIEENMLEKADPTLVKIALQNLLGNSLKYAMNSNPIEISFTRKKINHQWQYEVRDNGVGFDMQYSNKIFSAFSRLHGQEFEGTGVGLSTVQRVIKRHRGRIWAESIVNEGAQFFFTFSE